MNKTLTGALGLSLMATTAFAGGLDRSGQSALAVFNDPGTLTLSFGSVSPSITGVDTTGGAGSYDVGNSYTQVGASYVHGFSETFSLALILDQPFGADVEYSGTPATDFLAGTSAVVDSNALSMIGRYKLNDNVSVFGGLRAQKVSADISLNGVAYGGIDYSADVASSTGVGYTVGAAYEIPEIALRAALTYHSEVEHSATMTEAFGGTTAAQYTTEYVTPKSVNLDFQTGIAADTLLTAGVRWAEWSSVDVIAVSLGSADLVTVGDSTTYRLGVARRFNENLAGSISFTYEKEGDPLGSPLAPTNGVLGVTIGGQYTMDNMTISGGINYSMPGDATPETTGVSPAATFEDNSAVGIGFSVAFQI